MAGFTSYDDIINECTTNGKNTVHSFYKISTAPEVAGGMHSLWKVAGLPGTGADPAATPGTAYDDAAGSMILADQASDYKYLLRAEVVSNVACTLILYDRLVGVSALNLASTGNKTVSSAALPRYTDGIGVEAWLEVTTASTATACVVNMNSYTDTGDNTGQSGGNATFPAAATNVDTIVPLTLAAGDVGVKACSTINVGTASTALVVNFLLVKRIAMIPLIANTGTVIDFTRAYPPMPRIYDGASLCAAFVAGSTGAHTIQGMFTFGWG